IEMAKGKDAKPHIGIFGRRNHGKSSIINVLSGQEVAIVSEVAGTTTDPVKKSMEIPGIGPVILIDTAGIDDIGELGAKRIEKTLQALKTVDAAILVIAENLFGDEELRLIEEFRNLDVPFFIIHNKTDIQPLSEQTKQKIAQIVDVPVISFSAKQPHELETLIKTLREIIPPSAYQSKSLIGDLICHGDTDVTKIVNLMKNEKGIDVKIRDMK
ncbi:MAG TPA: GTP-binding protein, partial [Bacteroidales bacterium]|nr:GTP-binding protein [Bacteroidales bacterium]